MKTSLTLLMAVLLAACATDATVQQSTAEAKPGECIRRTGSNVCAKYHDRADPVIDAGTKDLESSARRRPV